MGRKDDGLGDGRVIAVLRQVAQNRVYGAQAAAEPRAPGAKKNADQGNPQVRAGSEARPRCTAL